MLTFCRIFFWQKCQEMRLGMKTLINTVPGFQLWLQLFGQPSFVFETLCITHSSLSILWNVSNTHHLPLQGFTPRRALFRGGNHCLLTNWYFKVHSRAGFIIYISSAQMFQFIFKELLFLLHWANSGRLNRSPGGQMWDHPALHDPTRALTLSGHHGHLPAHGSSHFQGLGGGGEKGQRARDSIYQWIENLWIPFGSVPLQEGCAYITGAWLDSSP